MRTLPLLALGISLLVSTPATAALSTNTGPIIIAPVVPGAAITTTVSDISGAPLAGAVVTIYKDAAYTQIADNTASSGSTADATGTTDAVGKITMTVPAGSYYLYTSYDLGLAGKVTSVQLFTAVSGVADQRTVQLVFVGNNATVTVTDVLNAPLAGADIVVYKDAAQTQIADNQMSNVSSADATGKTDAQGQAHFLLANGTYYISFKYTVPGTLGVVNGNANWTVTGGVQNTRTLQITSVGINTNVTVTDIAGAPVAGAQVVIYTDAGQTHVADDYHSNVSMSDASATTDATGKVQFNLAAGSYYPYVKYDFGLAGATTLISSMTVVDDTLNQKTIQNKLIGTNSIVKVSDQNGVPLTGAVVTVFTDAAQTHVADNLASNSSAADATGQTDTQGKIGFTTHGGSYFVQASYGPTASAVTKTQSATFVDGTLTTIAITLNTAPCTNGATVGCTPPPPTVTVEPCIPTTTKPCTPTTSTDPCVPTTARPCTPPPPTTDDKPCGVTLNALIPCTPPPPPPTTDDKPCGVTLNALIPCEPPTPGTESTVSRMYSTVTVDPKAILADGTHTALVSVTVRDGANKPVVGATVTVSTPLPNTTWSATSGATDTTGRITFTLKGTKAGVALIQTTANTVTLNTVAVELSTPGQCPFVAGSLFKLADDGNKETQTDNAVYYYGTDCKRHAFPNERIFGGWYQDFGGITTVSPDQLARMTLGKNVVYRPAARMVKFTTLNKVYVVGKGGVLRWITSEAVAKGLYGADWNKKIDDLSDAFFTNYSFGADVQQTTEFDPSEEQDSAPSISMNF